MTTKAEKSAAARLLGASGASKGGLARRDALTPARRKEIALMGVEARRKRKLVAGLTYEAQ